MHKHQQWNAVLVLHVVLYTILSLELIKTKTYYLNAAHNLLLLNELYSVYLVNILLKCCLHWKALKIEWTRRSRKKKRRPIEFHIWRSPLMRCRWMVCASSKDVIASNNVQKKNNLFFRLQKQYIMYLHQALYVYLPT